MAEEIIITIVSNNDNNLIFHGTEGQTLKDVLSDATVKAFFMGAETQELLDSVVEAKGADCEDNAPLRLALVNAAIADGDEVIVNVDSIEPVDAATDDCEGCQGCDGCPGSGVIGTVTVVAGRGAEKVTVDIKAGATLRDILFSDRVKGRVGMTDAQISNCAVTAYATEEPTLGDSGIQATATDLDDPTFVKVGMSLWLTPKTAHDKGSH